MSISIRKYIFCYQNSNSNNNNNSGNNDNTSSNNDKGITLSCFQKKIKDIR